MHLYAFAYEYDAAGNRLQKTFNGETTYYSYNNLNQLTTEAILGGDATYYTWTADGAMETKHDGTGWTYYTWDVDESLRTIQAPNVTLDNRYNARMQRVRREEDASASNLIYDAQKLIAEATEEGLTRYYLSEGGSVYSPLVSQLGSQHWQLFDALGTVLGLTATDGSQSDSFLYEAFGTSLGRTGTTGTPYQYVGGYGYFNEPSVGLEQVGSSAYYPDGAAWLAPGQFPRVGGSGVRKTRLVALPWEAGGSVAGTRTSAGLTHPAASSNFSLMSIWPGKPPWIGPVFGIVTGCITVVATFVFCDKFCHDLNPYPEPPIVSNPFPTPCEKFNTDKHNEWQWDCTVNCFREVLPPAELAGPILLCLAGIVIA